MVTFEMNGKDYRADSEVLELLRGLVQQAKATNDSSAVDWVMALGKMTGRITEIA